jgi:hypothetical protein
MWVFFTTWGTKIHLTNNCTTSLRRTSSYMPSVVEELLSPSLFFYMIMKAASLEQRNLCYFISCQQRPIFTPITVRTWRLIFWMPCLLFRTLNNGALWIFYPSRFCMDVNYAWGKNICLQIIKLCEIEVLTALILKIRRLECWAM